MLPKSSSLLRHAMRVTAALVLGLSVPQSAFTQAPPQPGEAPGYSKGGPTVPESLAPRDRPAGSSYGGMSSGGPVLTPGYFEVVCPAICYGGAFHVCNKRAFAGPGYYGPFRRYWAYGIYGPSFNIGPDDSLQYGLYGGVMYVATRACKGLHKHGKDRWAASGAVPMTGGTGGGTGGAYAPPAGSPNQRPVEKLPPPTGNTAYLRLLVPENAEVLVEGSKTTTTGKVREFVSPPLDPGKSMIYSVLVRHTDAGGKKIEETHSIRVQANQRLVIDCTKPANGEQPRATVLRP